MYATGRLAACTAVLIVLAGCALHRPAEVSLPSIPDAYREAPASAGEVPERWWRTFGDPVLDGLMVELFGQNLDLEQAFARHEQARAALRSVHSARLPSVTAEGEGGRSMQPSFAGDFTGDSRRFAVAAAFELDLWGKLASRSKAAAKEEAASLEELRTLYLGLSAQLTDLYYLAVEQRSQLELSDRTIDSFSDTVQRVEGRYRMGLVPPLDVYQSRQSLAAARAGRYLFEANLAAAEHAIAVLLGRYPDRETAGRLVTLPAAPAAFPTGLPSELVGLRPDLRALLRRIEAADARVAAAIADRFPSVNLLGSFGRSRQEFATGLIEGEFWSLLADLALPVVDGGRRRAEVDRSRAVVQEVVARYRQAVLEAFGEVEDALVSNRTTEQRIVRLEETEAATDAALRLSLDRYLNGLTDYLPVLTAQRRHYEAQILLLAARRQLVSARISLARALGGRWMDDELEQRLKTAQRKGSR